MYNTLSRLLPMAPQVAFFWRKLGKPFASMLEQASFPLNIQCRCLIFVYARVLGMMGPHDGSGNPSFMTYDGSPVELSWIIPKADPTRKHKVDRQIRFAIEPIDPRTGGLLPGALVLDYLASPVGSLGIVDCQDDAMAWRRTLENFLFPGTVGSQIRDGSKFFVGFDFTSAGIIKLKAYYIPAPKPTLGIRNSNARQESVHLWDPDWTRLRNLVMQLHPSLIKPLDKLISFIDGLDDLYKPRIEIFSVDCVGSNVNRLKIYCRPREGASWSDACRVMTLGGRISSPAMIDALAHLEVLWNNLFPSSRSTSNRQLELPLDSRSGARLSKRNAQHPTRGLLYYFSLHPGTDIPLPKIYLPVSRYCRNDLQICRAVEQVYKVDEKRNNTTPACPEGWVAREVANTFNHRNLTTRTGIHTYITLAYKGKGWEMTNYFSPEVWS
ncbi:hypothetical protein AMATHDRAFT_76985 [Amanita thiersii Skay4041]|uniref:Aromatic prenyltransferase n=1 Tax=Amanita thiersii Skay4041 TaxID=703135 RepID=A0A2A9NJK5_9AGAR|nr:hypothetical protein AMATHDRAFT_76985 [Amanita thiersii Skay4041]